MAAKTLFFRNLVSPVSGNWLVSETQGGATDDTTTTHTGDGTANTFQIIKPGVSQGTTTNATLSTSAPPVTANQFGWFSDVAYNGTFAASTWAASLKQDDTTNSNGFPNINVYKCSNQNFGGTWTFLFTITGGTSWWNNSTSTVTASATPSAITLNNEYLFFQVWCNETTAISAKTHHFHCNGTTSQSQIVTPNFTPVSGISRRQTAQAISTSGTASLAATFPTATQAGNLLVAFVTRSGGTTITNVTASNSTTLTQAVALNTAAFAAIYYYPNCPSGITGITLTLTFDSCSIQIAEYSGIATSSPLDKTSSHDGGFSPGSTSWTSSTTATLSQTGELIVGGGVEWRAITTVMSAGTGFNSVLLSSDNRTIYEDIIGDGTTTAIAATGTATNLTNGQVYALVATFLPTSSGTKPPSSLMMLGCGT